MRIKKVFNESEVYFMSDLHYGHENIIRMGGRPFDNTEEMNTWIEKILEDTLKPGDVVFDLGDLFWKSDMETIKRVLGIMKNKGIEFYKILGNHDKDEQYLGWIHDFWPSMYVADRIEIWLNTESGKKENLVLEHFPLYEWNRDHYGSWMIHGHCHGNIDDINDSGDKKIIDIGFDAGIAKKKGTFLITFKDIIEYVRSRKA